jgi:hypothetical protein
MEVPSLQSRSDRHGLITKPGCLTDKPRINIKNTYLLNWVDGACRHGLEPPSASKSYSYRSSSHDTYRGYCYMIQRMFTTSQPKKSQGLDVT